MNYAKAVLIASLTIFTTCASTQARTWNINNQSIDLSQFIKEAELKGAISAEQANKLRDEEGKVFVKEDKMRRKHNGQLTEGEAKQLNNDLSKILQKLNKLMALKSGNTGTNYGDDLPSSPTPQVQSESKQDVQIVRSIRQELVKDDTLSTSAKNIKVIVINGTVTLRGPVKTETEKARVQSIAARYVGDGNVLNKLEISQ